MTDATPAALTGATAATPPDRRIGLSYESDANLFYRDMAAGVREAAAARGCPGSRGHPRAQTRFWRTRYAQEKSDAA